MKAFSIICLAALVSLCFSSTSSAQVRSPELNELTQRIEREVREKVPEWSRRTGVSMAAGDVVTDKVAVDYWTDGVSILKVSILSHDSEKEASGLMNRYTDEKSRGKVEEALGDEAATLNENEIVVFRKRNLTIFIAEIGEVRFKKESTLAKKFAHLISTAFDKESKPIK